MTGILAAILLTGAGLALVPSLYRALRGPRPGPRLVPVLAGLGLVVPALAAAIAFARGEGDSVVPVLDLRWLTVGGLELRLHLAVDAVTRAAALLVGVVGSLAIAAGPRAVRRDEAATVAALGGLFLLGAATADLLGLLAVGALSGAATTLRIAPRRREDPGLAAFLVHRFADLALVGAALLVLGASASLEFAALRAPEVAERLAAPSGVLGFSRATLAGALLIAGVMARVGLPPFSAAATSAGALPAPLAVAALALGPGPLAVLLFARCDGLLAASPTAVILASVIAGSGRWARPRSRSASVARDGRSPGAVGQLSLALLAATLAPRSRRSASSWQGPSLGRSACPRRDPGGPRHRRAGRARRGGAPRPRLALAAALAGLGLAGLPPTAGYFLQDRLRWAAFATPLGHGWFLWLLGSLAGFVTAPGSVASDPRLLGRRRGSEAEPAPSEPGIIARSPRSRPVSSRPSPRPCTRRSGPDGPTSPSARSGRPSRPRRRRRSRSTAPRSSSPSGSSGRWCRSRASSSPSWPG
ncbi:MAG: hypothetical protein R3F20_18835 [Planctomycetota bacterium]